jgi:hypothetical protein
LIQQRSAQLGMGRWHVEGHHTPEQ